MVSEFRADRLRVISATAYEAGGSPRSCRTSPAATPKAFAALVKLCSQVPSSRKLSVLNVSSEALSCPTSVVKVSTSPFATVGQLVPSNCVSSALRAEMVGCASASASASVVDEVHPLACVANAATAVLAGATSARCRRGRRHAQSARARGWSRRYHRLGRGR